MGSLGPLYYSIFILYKMCFNRMFSRNLLSKMISRNVLGKREVVGPGKDRNAPIRAV
jgi:hypothetical protein